MIQGRIAEAHVRRIVFDNLLRTVGDGSQDHDLGEWNRVVEIGAWLFDVSLDRSDDLGDSDSDSDYSVSENNNDSYDGRLHKQDTIPSQIKARCKVP